jgi:hypothetical protein
MPTVKDKQGNVVAELPYNEAGEAQAEKIVEENPNFEVVDAGSRRESYHLGGAIPGDVKFGQRPISPPLPNPIKSPLPGTADSVDMARGDIGPGDEWPEPGPGDKFHTSLYKEGGKVPEYKKGGKARRQARRAARQEKRNVRKISKLQKKGAEVTTTAKTLKETKQLKPTGKIRPGTKAVKVTKGGAYPSYKKASVPAKSFKSAFASASKAGKKTFTWDGRSYTTKKK